MLTLSKEAREALDDKSPPKTPYPKGFPKRSPYDRITIFKITKLLDWSWKTKAERKADTARN